MKLKPSEFLRRIIDRPIISSDNFDVPGVIILTRKNLIYIPELIRSNVHFPFLIGHIYRLPTANRVNDWNGAVVLNGIDDMVHNYETSAIQFSQKNEAVRWVIQRSAEIGVIRNYFDNHYSALEQLAES